MPLEDTQVVTVSLEGILNQDESALMKLFQACSIDGVFILDIKSSEPNGSHHPVLDEVPQVFDLSAQIFDLPETTKLEYEMDKWSDLQIGGYKAAGKHSGVVSGKRDGFENFLVPLNSLLALTPSGPFPRPIQENLALLTSFSKTCHSISTAILGALTPVLDSRPRSALESSYRRAEPSTTSLALPKYLPSAALTPDQVGHMAHTDVGSLTLLFTSTPGLQVLHQADGTWRSVTPPPGSVVVNVGDTLSFLTGGACRSCVHRVVPAVDEATGTSALRWALAWFLRPELEARFVDRAGREWTGEEWHRTKYKIFRAGVEEQKRNGLLTGRRDFLGEWTRDESRGVQQASRL